MSLDHILQNSDIYTYDYFHQENVCRFCWDRDAHREMYPKPREDFNASQSDILSMVRNCLDIEIHQDSIPRYACENCMIIIEKYHNFKEFCKETDRRLREIFEKCKETVDKIKCEDVSDIKSNKSDSLENVWDNLRDTDSDDEPLEKHKEKKIKGKYTRKRSPTYCNICRIDFKTSQEFVLHNSKSHGIEENGMYKCFGCEKRFHNRKARLGHEITYCKGLQDGYKCIECGRYLPKRRMYEAHMRDHRENVLVELPEDLFECYKCKKLLKTRESLKKHMAAHRTDKKNFVCESCGRIFTRQDYLHKHKLTHTGTKEHVCSQCDFRATQRSSLVVHMRKHTGERPYSCDMCPQRCISSSNLRAHRMRHMGLKNYQCKLCNKTFGYKISLEEHVGSVHERSESHSCQFCGSTYTRLRGLRRHLLSKHRKERSDPKLDYLKDIPQNDA